MTQPHEQADHRFLANGIELAVLPLPGRSLAAMQIRVFAGYACESPEHLGLANVLAEAITKGTERRDARAFNDAFDAIGATHAAAAGRETVTFSCLCLPEFLGQAIALHAEMISTPTFPDDACRMAVELTRQALGALNDDPGELARKLLHDQAYGQPLGRHAYGQTETLARISRREVLDHWRRHFSPRRMQVAVAGAVEPAPVADQLERAFEPLSGNVQATAGAGDRPVFRLNFAPGRTHHDKDVEQVQIALCLPGSAATDADQAVEQVLVGVLAGGMSSRLWTAVRQKQGLVYWVGAWHDRPRAGGMLHLGASATPQNAGETRDTLLAELDRVGDDLTEPELERAITGLVASTQTHGDVTHAKAGSLANDLFYHGRPIRLADKIAEIQAVRVADIRTYLDKHPRDAVGMVTLGPVTANGP